MGGTAAMFAVTYIMSKKQEMDSKRAARHDMNSFLASQPKDEAVMPGAADATKAYASELTKARSRKGFQSTVLTNPLGGASKPLTLSPVLG